MGGVCASLGEVELAAGLARGIELEQGCVLVLGVKHGGHLDAGNLCNSLHTQLIVDVDVESGLADHVEVLPDIDFLLCNTFKFSILQNNVDSVVDIGPLGSVVDLAAKVCVALHKVAGLHKVIEKEFLLKGPVGTLFPAGTERANSLGGRDDASSSHFF